MSGEDSEPASSGSEISAPAPPVSEFELRIVPLGFYYSVGLVLRGGEARLLGMFFGEASLTDACEPWSALSLHEPQELERGWASLQRSPFQLAENWQLALNLAVANDRLFVGHLPSGRETVLTLNAATLEGGLDTSEVPSFLVQALRAATRQFSPAAEPFGGAQFHIG